MGERKEYRCVICLAEGGGHIQILIWDPRPRPEIAPSRVIYSNAFPFSFSCPSFSTLLICAHYFIYARVPFHQPSVQHGSRETYRFHKLLVAVILYLLGQMLSSRYKAKARKVAGMPAKDQKSISHKLARRREGVFRLNQAIKLEMSSVCMGVGTGSNLR